MIKELDPIAAEKRANTERRKDFRRSEDFYELESKLILIKADYKLLLDKLSTLSELLNQVCGAVFGHPNERGVHQYGIMDRLERFDKIGGSLGGSVKWLILVIVAQAIATIFQIYFK